MCEQYHGTVFDQFLNDKKKGDFDDDCEQGSKRKFLLILAALNVVRNPSLRDVAFAQYNHRLYNKYMLYNVISSVM